MLVRAGSYWCYVSYVIEFIKKILGGYKHSRHSTKKRVMLAILAISAILAMLLLCANLALRKTWP